MEKNQKKITIRTLKDIMAQNQEFRELLENWPAREVMMDYEKDWNEKRMRTLSKHRIYDPKEFGL